MNCKSLLAVSILLTFVAPAVAAPQVGKASRYCNPLPIVSSAGGSAAGDVTVIREQGKYYMYCTGGGAWVCDDMLNWTFHRVANVPVAPHVVRYKGSFYMCGNDSPLYKADHPLGPFTSLGPWKDTPDVAGGWNGAFDVDLFVDDDNQPYLYYSGKGVSGIYVVPLDPNDLTRFAGRPRRLFGFNPDHVWERYGQMNEYLDVAWIEGPWMQKYNGMYYLQYSASGTQWKTYASGYYTARSPLGPFEYAPNNPLLRRTDGIVTGPAHGCVVEGPDGKLWQFYTIVFSNPPGGRRVGMDRICFDRNGNMMVRITDTPQWAPGAVSDPNRGDSGSIPLSINKLRAMNARSQFSSERLGHYAAYAVDNSNGTWWEPEPNDAKPTLTIDLSPATRFDRVQLFTVDSVRLIFLPSRGRRYLGNTSSLQTAPGADRPVTNAYQYKVEVSLDGNEYSTVLDQTKNAATREIFFDEISPVECRFVRLSITNWPRTSPLGIIEFTVFGRPSRSLPAELPIPGMPR
ncbi:MAG: family 43 glycosylhydrolase [Sedimentisphaerales bacterium]|nr:family 43 glycosylhydrolase [Sedimentisphaerales bacterium]